MIVSISSNRAMWDLARGGSIGGRTFLLKDRTTLQDSSIWREKASACGRTDNKLCQGSFFIRICRFQGALTNGTGYGCFVAFHIEKRLDERIHIQEGIGGCPVGQDLAGSGGICDRCVPGGYS
jgi:hypothetical protein